MDGVSYGPNVNSNDGEFNSDRSNEIANRNEGVRFLVRQPIAIDVYWTLLRQPPSMRPISVTLACSWCKVVSLASFCVSKVRNWNWTISA